MKIARVHVASVVEALLEHPEVRKATRFVSEDTVVKASAPHKVRNGRATTVVLTVGPPNYAERAFIASCRSAGEPLPVKRVQFKFWPKK